MQVKKIRFNTETNSWEYVNEVSPEKYPTLDDMINILSGSDDNTKRPDSFTDILVGLLPSIEIGVEEMKEAFKDKTIDPVKTWFDKSVLPPESNDPEIKRAVENLFKKFKIEPLSSNNVKNKPKNTFRERLENKRKAVLDEQQKTNDEKYRKYVVDSVVSIIVANIESQLSQYNGGDIFSVYTEINYKALPSGRTVDEMIQSVVGVLHDEHGIDVENCVACKVNTENHTVVFEYVEDLN